MLPRVARSLLVALLLVAGTLTLGALLPRNGAWRAPNEGVPVWVRSNGVHTDIVMPVRALGLDWHQLAPPAHVRNPALAGDWIAIGTGERVFFLETPRWEDVRPATVAGALFGGDLLLHAEHVAPPRPGPMMRPLRLRPDEYRRLVALISADFRRDAGGRPIPLPGTGYGARDIFYLALGRYDALRTCNQWTANRLAGAGVRVGRWTPLASSLLASIR